MAATYGNSRLEGTEYRDSLRSAQSTSVYSTDSSYLESSPLDSIIRDYPPVPGASPNAFKFSPLAENNPGRFQRPQQQQRGAETPARLREYSPLDDHAVGTANLNAQAHDRHDSSPLLHTRFRSPTNSASPEPREPRRPSPDGGTEDNFIDLRDSGSFSPPPLNNPSLPAPLHQPYNYNYSGHGVPPRQGHGVTPLLTFTRPTFAGQPGPEPSSHFSPITPDVVDPTPTQSKPRFQELLIAGKPGSSSSRDDYFDRSSWGTQYSDVNGARQTWMTSTSGVTVGDPFAFRHYETPQHSPAYPPNAPTVVVHEPETPTQASVTGSRLNGNGYHGPGVVEADDAVDIYAYTPPSPLEPPVQGRAPSKVPVANRYNFSRPMRSEVSPPPLAVMPERDSEYSTMSGSTDVPHTYSDFPEPPIPNPVVPSSYNPPSQREDDPPLTRRAIARMSIPKTIPNLVYTDDQHSPGGKNDFALNGFELHPNQGSSSRPGTNQGPGSGSTPRNLSPIPDRSRSNSPVSMRSSPRFNAPSPLPGPPRTYDVPYSYNVTITGHQYDASNFNQQNSTSSHSDNSSHGTRYSLGGTALPPPPREVVALPSAPPSTEPRPGSSLSLYSRYSFYSVGDLPNSGNSTPLGWDKNGKPRTANGKNSPSNRTPTPTNANNNGKSKSTEEEYQGLPYLNSVENAVAPSGPTPQECLLLGISHHEANRLEESALWFEKAANEQGGCGVGMLMWGLSLRHAWGVEKDERAAFWWLRRAAECAVADMEKTKEKNESEEGAANERDRKAVQSELVLAVYEVGQCFFHGWGVDTDKKMAVSYFQVAARLGDVDAQLELGFCFANGKGCKKDLKEAARWYRAAAAQGASTVGLAWIYKPKYGGGTDGDNGRLSIDKLGRPILPSSMGSSASVKSGKSDGRRRLKKPPPRSRTPSGRSKSPARTEFSTGGDTMGSP